MLVAMTATSLTRFLEELFRRIRADAAPGERSSAEAAITRLKRIFGEDDDDAGPAAGGGPRAAPTAPDFDAGTIYLAS